MSTTRLASLISAQLLNRLILEQSFNNKYRLIEANIGPETKPDYEKEHIPNAQYYNIMQGVEPSKYFPKNIPTADTFKENLKSLGVSNNHHVIIYDRSPYGLMSSTRLWMIFRIYGHEKVTVLNGGLNAWKAKNLPLTSEIITFKAEREFNTEENKQLLVNYEQIVENLKTKQALVVDARPRADFTKVDADTGKQNCIPESKNVPYAEMFDSTKGTLKDPKELSQMFKRENVHLRKPLIFSCMTSVQASGLAFVAYLLGSNNIQIYQGSWSEFSQRQKET